MHISPIICLLPWITLALLNKRETIPFVNFRWRILNEFSHWINKHQEIHFSVYLNMLMDILKSILTLDNFYYSQIFFHKKNQIWNVYREMHWSKCYFHRFEQSLKRFLQNEVSQLIHRLTQCLTENDSFNGMFLWKALEEERKSIHWSK